MSGVPEFLDLLTPGYLSKMIHWPNAGSMLGQRSSRWLNIKPAFGRCIVLTGNSYQHQLMYKGSSGPCDEIKVINDLS